MLLSEGPLKYFTHKAVVFFLLMLLVSAGKSLYAQTHITISGQVIDKENPFLPLSRIMIINKRTNHGIFADAEGKFSINSLHTDTLIFSVIGYNTKKICLKDSVLKNRYNILIEMNKLYYTLKEISVFGTRTLNDIDKDIAKLDSTRRMRYYQDINAISSPITYLYERFSKFGRSKQKVAAWENEDLKIDILKDLFRLYVKNDIINLNEDEFEAFIAYCNLSEEFIKTSNQFELVMAIKGKYEAFTAGKDYYIPHEKRW